MIVGLTLTRKTDVQQFPHGQMSLRWMVEQATPEERVTRAASTALTADVTRPLQVRHDALRGAFGDVASDGDVAETDVGVACDGQEHTGVIGEEPPPDRVIINHIRPLRHKPRDAVGGQGRDRRRP
ncbi:hypothetical protein ACF09I_29010 [Streptomyces sp. NPDC014940]|uniref:hypothetical protein n=1 Tax=Streptomyces sp. NPDC014940 TaxID=3364932 RepID=UPI00370126B3